MKIKILFTVVVLLISSCGLKQSTISGDMYFVENNQAQKIAGVEVYLFKKETADSLAAKNISLYDSRKDAEYTAVTDPEGKFGFNPVLKGDYYIVSRYVRKSFGTPLKCLWNQQISAQQDAVKISLNQTNLVENPYQTLE